MRYALASRSATSGVGTPVAVNDSATVASLDAAIINVLANDPGEIDPATLEIVATGSNGEALAIPNGTALYQCVGDPIYLARLACDANVPLTTNYTPVLTAGTGSSVTAIAKGFRLTAGPLGAGNTPGAANAWAHVVSKLSGLGKNVMLVFDMTIHDSSPGSSAGEAILVSMSKGAGTAGFPADPNTWAVRDGTTRYTTVTNTRGYRVTLAPGSQTANNRDQVRARIFPSDEQILDSLAPNTQPGGFPFVKDITYRCVIVKFDTKFRFTYWPLTEVPEPPLPPASAWVQVANTVTFAPGADVVTPNLIAGQNNKIQATVVNRHYDCRGFSLPFSKPASSKGFPLEIFVSSGTAAAGLEVIGDIPANAYWDDIYSATQYDGAGFQSTRNATSDGNIIAEHMRLVNIWEGLRITSDVGSIADKQWTVRSVYVRGWRDDGVEADNNFSGKYAPGLIEDCLFDGGFIFLSHRAGGQGGNATSTVTTKLFHNLVWLRPQPYKTDLGGTVPPDGSLINEGGVTKGHGQIFKCNQINQSLGTSYVTLEARHNIFRVDRLSVNGPTGMFFPTNGTYENNLLLWFGGGAYPGVLPASGVTVVKGAETYGGRTKEQIWDQERALWLTSHGCTDGNGDHFTFLDKP